MKKYQTLMIVLICALSVVVNCGGGGGSGGTVYPGTPTGVTVTVNDAGAGKGTVTLHWNAATNGATYRVRYDYSSGLSKTTGIPYQNVITGTSFTTPEYPVNSKIYFVVTALTSKGIEGPASAEVSARIAAPSQPSTIIAVASSNTNTPWVSLRWSAVSEATAYNLYRDTLSTVSTTTALARNITGTAFVDTAVSNGTTYYYKLRGMNGFGEGLDSLVTSATPTTGASSTITISGKVAYEDKEYDRNVGFTGVTTFKAVRFADVELVSAASGSAIVPAGRTLADGSYSVSVSPSDIGTGDYYVRVISSATPAGLQQVKVKNWSKQLFSVKTDNFRPAGNTSINLSIPVTNQADGAFNILDVMTSGFEFLNVYAAGSSTLNALALNVFWQNNYPYGTFYCPNGTPVYPTACPEGAGISVFSDPFGSEDTDEFDDDVLLHEFGHFVLDNFSRDDSMGGYHTLTGNDYDMRLTWSEGWGDFFQGAVKFWLNNIDSSLLSSKPGMPSSQYVDTVVGGAALIVDVADPDNTLTGDCSGACKYSTNEIAVANILWNHVTGTGKYGMQPIWNVISGFKASPDVVNLEAYWDGWKGLYGDPIASIYTNRSVYYSDDQYETDNVYTSAQTFTVNGGSQNRRLYSSTAWSSADADYVMFTATTGSTYTITTADLRNGADTYLTLLSSSDTTTLTTNDNTSGITWLAGNGMDSCSGYQNYDCDIYYYGYGWVWQEAPSNNGSNLASSIVWIAPSSGTYYLKVSPAANRPKSAGRYGSYTLNITSP